MDASVEPVVTEICLTNDVGIGGNRLGVLVG